MTVESTRACSDIRVSHWWVRFRQMKIFTQYSGRGILEFWNFFYLSTPPQIMKVLKSNIPVQISQLLRKRIGNKDSEYKDKGWKTRGKVQTTSNQELFSLRGPAAGNTQDCCHQQRAQIWEKAQCCNRIKVFPSYCVLLQP